jgi:hypothetical protein
MVTAIHPLSSASRVAISNKRATHVSTSHMNHVANQPNQETEIGEASDSGAGWSGSENRTIIPLPVYHGDVCGSLLGTMLFPNDAAKAESYCAGLLTKGPVQEYRRAGHTLSLSREITLFDALGRGIRSREIETQQIHGQRVGDVIKTLSTLIWAHRKIASWESAIRIVKDQSAGASLKTSRATLRAHLSEMRSVLHLWGAFALRDYQFLADPKVGYEALDDLTAFMAEAMALWQHLCGWRDGRNQTDTYLRGGVFGPWLDWQPHQPRTGWPDIGRLYATSFDPSVRLPTRRPPGRPPGRRNPVR